jgi:hypothetical protein
VDKAIIIAIMNAVKSRTNGFEDNGKLNIGTFSKGMTIARAN